MAVSAVGWRGVDSYGKYVGSRMNRISWMVVYRAGRDRTEQLIMMPFVRRGNSREARLFPRPEIRVSASLYKTPSTCSFCCWLTAERTSLTTFPLCSCNQEKKYSASLRKSDSGYEDKRKKGYPSA